MIKKYEIKNHIIYHGDAMEVLRDKIADNSIDLIFVDPPYNIGKHFDGFYDKWSSDEAYAEWCEEWLTLCIDKLAVHGSMYVMASTQSMPYIDLILRERIKILSRIVWLYDSSGVQAENYYGSLYEPILFCVKDHRNYTFNADAIVVEAKTGAKRKLIDYRKKVPTVYSTTKVPGNTWYFPRVRYRMDEYEDHPYLNIKTKAASKGSKSRPSFANLYALYVLIEDYLLNNFDENGEYETYEGAQFSQLFKRQRELPFGSKLQNHALNHRLNGEFKRYFPEEEILPIIRDVQTNKYWINEGLLIVDLKDKHFNIAGSVLKIIGNYILKYAISTSLASTLF